MTLFYSLEEFTQISKQESAVYCLRDDVKDRIEQLNDIIEPIILENNQKKCIGVLTDGDLKRLMRKSRKIDNLKIKNFMTKKPFVVEENMLASEILSQMNKKKITNVCIYNKKNKHKTIGVLHIHDLLNNLR